MKSLFVVATVLAALTQMPVQVGVVVQKGINLVHPPPQGGTPLPFTKDLAAFREWQRGDLTDYRHNKAYFQKLTGHAGYRKVIFPVMMGSWYENPCQGDGRTVSGYKSQYRSMLTEAQWDQFYEYRRTLNISCG